jgi:hypothetical protein
MAGDADEVHTSGQPSSVLMGVFGEKEQSDSDGGVMNPRLSSRLLWTFEISACSTLMVDGVMVAVFALSDADAVIWIPSAPELEARRFFPQTFVDNLRFSISGSDRRHARFLRSRFWMRRFREPAV